jgi:hypothetical protein
MSIESKRVFASQSMDSPIYRGKSWFVTTSIYWLSQRYPHFALVCIEGKWRVGLGLCATEPLSYQFYSDDVEEALAEAVLAVSY